MGVSFYALRSVGSPDDFFDRLAACVDQEKTRQAVVFVDPYDQPVVAKVLDCVEKANGQSGRMANLLGPVPSTHLWAVMIPLSKPHERGVHFQDVLRLHPNPPGRQYPDDDGETCPAVVAGEVTMREVKYIQDVLLTVLSVLETGLAPHQQGEGYGKQPDTAPADRRGSAGERRL